eukprot:bmy_12087T0
MSFHGREIYDFQGLNHKDSLIQTRLNTAYLQCHLEGNRFPAYSGITSENHCRLGRGTLEAEDIPLPTFVSIDRCLQLTYSCKIYRIQEPGFAKMISTVVWLMVLLIMVPNMIIPIKDIKEKPNVGCVDFKKEFGRNWHLLTNFICIAIFLNFSAIILISNCLVIRQLYRNKDNENYPNVKRALITILLVTTGYIICFVPYHIVRIPYTLSQTEVISDCSTRISLFKAKEATLLLAVSNLCFDPILYYHLSKAFRLKVTETFASRKETKAQKEKSSCENNA